MTKQEIFDAMEAAYAGIGSTGEGTFAGDILRACADGCAELWSTEIDGLERRAFVSLAEGEWLSRVCADRGVKRREGETDESLRNRTLESLARQGASGNADDYAAWCAEVPELLRVRVLPLHRGAGTVDILTVNQAGGAPEKGVLAAAQEIVDARRPVGADARVIAAEEKPLNVTAAVALADGSDLASVQAAFAAALAAYCRERALTARVISYAGVSALLLECQGAADVTSFTLNGGTGSVALEATETAVPGSIVLTEAES